MIFTETGALDVIVEQKEPSLMRYGFDGQELQLLTITNKIMATYKATRLDAAKMELRHGDVKEIFTRR